MSAKADSPMKSAAPLLRLLNTTGEEELSFSPREHVEQAFQTGVEEVVDYVQRGGGLATEVEAKVMKATSNA